MLKHLVGSEGILLWTDRDTAFHHPRALQRALDDQTQIGLRTRPHRRDPIPQATPLRRCAPRPPALRSGGRFSAATGDWRLASVDEVTDIWNLAQPLAHTEVIMVAFGSPFLNVL